MPETNRKLCTKVIALVDMLSHQSLYPFEFVIAYTAQNSIAQNVGPSVRRKSLCKKDFLGPGPPARD